VDLHLLTTKDNPFSPITQYQEWQAWDFIRYDSNGLLARVVRTSSELSDADQAQAIEDAIDEIIEQNVSGVHIKVKLGVLEVPSEDEDFDGTSDGRLAA
jgi:hypothetical protein